MAKYEVMVILAPNISEDQVQQAVTKYKEFLGQYSTQELSVKIWGKRRLAYPIGKFIDGIYVLFNFEGDGKQIAPLERAMRLSDEVIRFLTIKLSEKLVADEVVSGRTEAPTTTPVPAPTPVTLSAPALIEA